MDIREPVKHQNDVGLRILKRLLEKEGEGQGKNLVFSPLSIYMMLTLLAAGASKGQMLHDLLSFLNFKSIDELNSSLSEVLASVFRAKSAAAGPCVTTANGVWVANDLPVKPSFQKLLETLYKGKLNRVDFDKPAKVVDEANSWVNKETRGLISKIFDKYSVDQTTRMILANTIYFKAAWVFQFSDISTKNSDFHLLNGSSVKVPFMSSSRQNQSISVFDGFKVASLSYLTTEYGDRRDFSMLIFLPDDRDGLPSLIQRACSESGFLDRHRPQRSVPVDKFKIPKFKFEFEFKMVQTLKDLGLGSLFSPGSGFTEMVEDPAGRELYVSNMFHKAVISVDEEGTEAAAVTKCHMAGCCLEMEPVIRISFVADHPFLFAITENVTGNVLFMGQVLDPSPH